MDGELVWLLWGLPIAFALGWIGARWDLRQWRREERDSPRASMRGLALLLHEKHDEAIDALIGTVQDDGETAELLFALGESFRRRGEYDRAVRVHEHLLQRGDLAKADRAKAQHALAQTYLRAGLFDRAEAAFGELAGTDFDTESQVALLALHERARDWAAATDVARRIESDGTGIEGPPIAVRIAHHHCERAIEADAAGRADEAARELEAARTAAPGHARPLVLEGERAAKRGNPAAALATWNALDGAEPPAFDLVAQRYAKAARALGATGGPEAARAVESAKAHLAAVAARRPSVEVLLARVALEDDAAARHALLAAHLEAHPSLAAAKAALEAGGERVNAGLRKAVERAAKPLHRFRCRSCAFEAENHFWQCPGCLGWDTIPPQRLEDR
jgi:lipopolysaccharide biosynthesis regulator YciM